MHFGLLLKNMERGYVREDHYRSAILTMKVGVIQECEYNLGWRTMLGQPHRTGGTSKGSYRDQTAHWILQTCKGTEIPQEK